MNSSTHKSPRSQSNPLAIFAANVISHFAFLEKQHGLKLIPVIEGPPEAQVVYEANQVRVKVCLEYPYQVWVVIELRVSKTWRRHGLHQLLKKLGIRVPRDVLRPNDTEPPLAFYAATLEREWCRIVAPLLAGAERGRVANSRGERKQKGKGMQL